MAAVGRKPHCMEYAADSWLGAAYDSRHLVQHGCFAVAFDLAFLKSL